MNNNPFDAIEAKLDTLAEQVNAIGEKLLGMNKAEPPEFEIGGIELAMQMTGLSRSAIYTHTCKKTIPFHKPPGSKKLIFYRSELKEWIQSKQHEN
jgi:predicted DNA-binding transcriptional regulator AlpA